MFNDFFQKLGDEMIKACRPAKGKAVKAVKGAKESKGDKAKKGAKKASSAEATKVECVYDREKMRECLLPLIPAHLKLDSIQTVDTSGFIPRGTDFLVYREYFRNLESMMSAVPSELVYGAFFLNNGLTAVSLGETLGKVADVKKLDRFSEQQSSGRFIPAFVLSMDMHMSYQDLKNLILDYYVSRSLDNCFEFDIMAIVNRGIVIKDWREKRSFKILDTGEDTLKWFFILINEYMDVEKEGSLELRHYIKQPVQYREY